MPASTSAESALLEAGTWMPAPVVMRESGSEIHSHADGGLKTESSCQRLAQLRNPDYTSSVRCAEGRPPSNRRDTSSPF